MLWCSLDKRASKLLCSSTLQYGLT